MKHVTATYHFKEMRGCAQSHLLMADDGHRYVVKVVNNPQHRRVLANELIATRLAKLLGLPVPEYELVNVPADLVQQSPGLKLIFCGLAEPVASGLAFGSRWMNTPSGVTDYLPVYCSLRNNADFARVLVLDKWAGNTDGRQCIFLRKPRARKWDVTFIDHGYCFNAGEWSFPDLPLRGAYFRDEVYEHVTGWDAFEPALTLAREMSIDSLASCMAGIPEEWHGDADALARLVQVLYYRRGLIPMLLMAFKKSSRNPFPRWSPASALRNRIRASRN